MAWITLVATPVLILLQAQLTFLPYHREWIVWLQRAAVLIDLALIWYFWIHFRSDDNPIKGASRKAWMYLGGVGALCVVIFSACLATFPGEWVDEHLPELRYAPTTWRPHWSKKDDWTSLHVLLFEGAIDELGSRPSSVFSNRLLLPYGSSIVDPEKLDKITVSLSFRGRDLRSAVLNLADLRKADFIGAQLQGAQLAFAQLQDARLGAAQLQGAWLWGAQLQGASLGGAQLQGARLDGGQLQGVRLGGAELQGAGLVNVRVWRAFGTPNLYLADFRNIDAHQKPWKDNETFGGWRDAIANSVPDRLLRDDVKVRLKALDPTGDLTGKKEPEDLLDQRYWDRAHSSQPQDEEFWGKRARFLADLACLGGSTPYIARGLLQILKRTRNPEFFLDAGGRKLFTDRLLKGKSDPTACPGVRGFTDTDWANMYWADPSKLTLTFP
jgi:hypothetical protein